jgi:hypothetical protein
MKRGYQGLDNWLISRESAWIDLAAIQQQLP